MKSISIVIPAYNEAKRISPTLNKIISYFEKKRYEFEVIVIDDGSKDNTREVIRRGFGNKVRIIENPLNRGKGYSVNRGYKNARNSYVLVTDSDLSTPIEEFDKLANYCKDYDIIIGSRKLPNSNVVVKQPLYRVIAGNMFPLIVKLLLLNTFNDTQCGFKLFNRVKSKKLFEKQTLSGFAFDVELLFLAKKYNYKVMEVGVKWENDVDTRLSLIKHSTQMFVDLTKIIVNNLLGKY